MEKNEENNNEENEVKENNNVNILNNPKYKIEILNESYVGNEIISKIILIGDSGVGKTSLSIRLTQKLFNDKTKSTIGFDIFKYVAKINDKVFRLQIWDTCGLEEFSSCTPSLYKNASLAIIVYAINDRKTFNHLENWKNLVKSNANPGTLIFVVGNKKDLEKENKRIIQKEEGEELIKKYGFNFFIEASAKDNEFVEEIFHQAMIQIYEKNVSNIENKGRIDFTKRKDSYRLKAPKQTKEENKKKKFVNNRLLVKNKNNSNIYNISI